MPLSRFLFKRLTIRPSCRYSRWMRLILTFQPCRVVRNGPEPPVAEPRLLPRQREKSLPQFRVAIRPRFVAVRRAVHLQKQLDAEAQRSQAAGDQKIVNSQAI